MMVLKKVFLTAVVGLVAAVGVVGPLYATTCIFYTEIDVWELEPVEVTVDGEPAEDLRAYEGLAVQFESQPVGGPVLVVEDVETEDDYQINFHSDEIPEELEQYSAEQGGE